MAESLRIGLLFTPRRPHGWVPSNRLTCMHISVRSPLVMRPDNCTLSMLTFSSTAMSAAMRSSAHLPTPYGTLNRYLQYATLFPSELRYQALGFTWHTSPLHSMKKEEAWSRQRTLGRRARTRWRWVPSCSSPSSSTRRRSRSSGCAGRRCLPGIISGSRSRSRMPRIASHIRALLFTEVLLQLRKQNERRRVCEWKLAQKYRVTLCPST